MLFSQVDAIHMLGEQIGIALAQAEEVGAKGDVEGSMKLMEKVEQLKSEKVIAEVSVETWLALSYIEI